MPRAAREPSGVHNFFRDVFFLRSACARACVLAFAVISSVSEFWLAPSAPGRMFPGVARAGLWRACADVASVPPRSSRDSSSVTRFLDEVRISFTGLGRKDATPGRCEGASALYGDVYGRNHWPTIVACRALVILYLFMSAMELCVLSFYYWRRRKRARGGFATASSCAYSTLATGAAVATSVAYATLVASIRDDTPWYVPDRGAFARFLGWGYWMFLACACASTTHWLWNVVDWDRASRARWERASRRNNDAETQMHE